MPAQQSIVIVDYGMGNVRSVARALHHVAPEAEVVISGEAAVINKADRLVLPGQGGMPKCMAALRQRPALLPALLKALVDKPVLGVCVGMQMLFEGSDEGGAVGLSVLPGRFLRFQSSGGEASPDGATPAGERLKVPQIGWNQIRPSCDHPILGGIAPGAHFYFVHSYYLPLDAATAPYALTLSDYGLTFVSAVVRGNLVATQFHPEKSGEVGLALYRNFCAWQPS